MCVDGMAVRDNIDTIRRVEDLSDLVPVDEFDDVDPQISFDPPDSRVATRLREIATLEDGWLDGEGLKVQAAVLAEAVVAVNQLADDPSSRSRVGRLQVFPTPEGAFSSGSATVTSSAAWDFAPT